MKPDQKQKNQDQDKKAGKATDDLAKKTIDATEAEQVRGGQRLTHDDEWPK